MFDMKLKQQNIPRLIKRPAGVCILGATSGKVCENSFHKITIEALNSKKSSKIT